MADLREQSKIKEKADLKLSFKLMMPYVSLRPKELYLCEQFREIEKLVKGNVYFYFENFHFNYINKFLKDPSQKFLFQNNNPDSDNIIAIGKLAILLNLIQVDEI